MTLPDSIVAIAGDCALLLLVGGAIGLADRARFRFGWLAVAALLIFLNDAALTRVYGLLPRMFPNAQWNWEGKALALAITLVVASLPAFGWRRVGLTFAQTPGSLRAAIPVAIVYCLFFVAIGFAFPDHHASHETIAFQLTMPGFEEEPFYRGILLLALNEAFRGRVRLLGVDWGWGAVLSCAMFGTAHAFDYSQGHFSLDLMTMALTALPAFIGVWLRERTGSLVLPIVLHNFGNSFSFFL